MICPECGNNNEDGVRFCGTCGALQQGAPVPKAAVRSRAKTVFQGSGSTAKGDSGPSNVLPMPTPGRGMQRPAPPPQRPVPPTPAAVPAVEEERTPTADVAQIASLDDLTGVVINNRYQVKDKLGEGGFGAVYRAEQLQMGRECALKVLHGKMARDPQVIGRFRREAKAASVLKDGHTVQIYDFDQTPEGIFYLAMELVRGDSLFNEIQKGPLPWQRVMAILDGICSSLGEAHSLGIVHRDIKPENIFLEQRPNAPDYVKVLDFGIAKITGAEPGLQGPALTAAGQTLGTVEYMSPEQLMGLELDGRSDLYALGVLSHEMLTGNLPFIVRTTAEMITAHLKTAPQPPSAKYPDLAIPPHVDAIVLRLLEKKREKRFANTAEVQQAVRQGPSAITSAAPAPSPGNPMATPVYEEAPSTSVTPRRSSSSKTNVALIVLGFLLVAAAAAAAMFLFLSKSHAEELAPSKKPAVRLVPDGLNLLASVDFAQLRAAGPPDVIEMLEKAARPALDEVGADPHRIGQVAAGAKMNGFDESDASTLVLLADLPIDKTKVGDKLGGEKATYKGVTLRKHDGAPSYAFLPQDRFLIGDHPLVEKTLDLSAGAGRPLVDGSPAALLKRVGAPGGTGPALLVWAKFTPKMRAAMKSAGQASDLDEVALSLTTGAAGADLVSWGRCATKNGARATAESAHAALDKALGDSTVQMMGFKPLLEAVKIANDGTLVSVTLHLTRAQYTDVMTRVAGLIAMSAAAAGEPDAKPAR